jgi:peptidoglycan hydrolase CwlO-like protein
MMDLSIITDLEAERDRLRAEAEKDYEDMRRFQKAYIEADQECRHLRAEVEEKHKLNMEYANELLAVRSDLAAAVEVLQEIAKQHLKVEAEDGDDTEHWDFEYAYETIIKQTRSLLARLEVRT